MSKAVLTGLDPVAASFAGERGEAERVRWFEGCGADYGEEVGMKFDYWY